ncbi:hypothetical protein SAMD00023353_1601760 [Rosellinia necatrix]|uniref:Uncharacterized protein n=1 Tax=Rosellinia necatrix TaxID=77044 RepID=A0A1W2TI61_ROSNE|nr:hypothetical protein SAMD00023353_1601760 [Rosellinia necatrix]
MSTTRRRQNSTVSTSSRPLPHHTRQKSRVPIEPKSAHVSDAFLQRFLGAGFSAADYLNATLPALQTSSSSSSAAAAVVRGNNNEPFLTTTTTSSSSPVPLAELSAQAQAQLSQLNAHTTRLTNTLTQLTDEILRSGGRLAYEVELLRGETLGLSETLAESLRDEVARFVPPDGPPRERTAAAVPPPTTTEATPTTTTATTTTAGTVVAVADPVFIGQLQTLTLVRSRLDTVVKTFGDAMEFVFPPSEVSVSSSFLSVSAPEPGSEDRSTEEKGQKVLRQLRDEISDLLRGNGGGGGGGGGSDPVEGIERAARRIEELKDLTAVWAGTAEEKGRTKFIDGLAKMVEDRHRELMREMEQAGRRDGRLDGESPGHKRSANGSLDATTGESRGLSGYGIMSQLQRLRTGL